jgi:hypothetical protein
VRKSLIAALAAVVVVAVGAVSVPLVERHAAAALKSQIEADGTTVGTVEVGLFDRSVTVTDAHSRKDHDVAIRRWRTSGIAWPLDELLRGRSPLAGWKPGDPLSAERVEFEDIRVVAPDGGQATVKSLVIEGLDWARYDGTVDPFRVALGARAVRALSMRKLELRDSAFVLPDGAGTLKVGEFRLDGVARGAVAGVTMTNLETFEGKGAQAFFKLADVNAKKLDVGRILAAMSSPAWQPGAPVGRIEVGSINVAGFGGSLLARYGVSVDDVTYQSVRETADVVRSEMRIRNFVMAPPLRGLESLQIRIAMQTMGLKSLKLEFGCMGTEDRGKGELAVERCALSGQDLGEIDFSMKITQADPIFWQAVDSGDLDAFMHSRASLATAKLVLADNSLLDRSLKAAAAATGKPAAQVRSDLAQEVRKFQPSDVLITEDLTKLLDTVARFIERGGTLTIEANPSQPFGVDRIAYLASPGPDLVDALGLTARLSR